MSENVAGVTLLAFGNGSPDIFAAIAGMRQGKPELVVGGLFGGGTFFVTTCASPVLSFLFVGTFKLNAFQFSRDVAFYLAATFWIFYIFISDHGIRFFDALGFPSSVRILCSHRYKQQVL